MDPITIFVLVLVFVFCCLPAACLFAVFQIGQGSAQVQLPPEPPAIVYEIPVDATCSPTNMVGWSLDYVTADGGCVYKAPQSFAPAASDQTDAPAYSGQTLSCSNGSTINVPVGGQIFWSNHRNGNTDDYAVVYDPTQGGSNDHPALGWWNQPCLPAGPYRVAHDVALILIPGNYRFTGPECRAWQNTDKNHPWEQGFQLIDRENMLSINVPATTGTNNEAYIAVKCETSWASGFSFERLP